MYETNLPIPSSSMARFMPDIARITRLGTKRPARETSTITRTNDHLILRIDGLEPIVFYRGRPGCLLPVWCFIVKRHGQNGASDAEASDAALDTVLYAWKHTSMAGKGDRKLVDLRDDEVLAYYEPISHGNSFAKVHLQGSGMRLVRLVVTTVLALKYRSFLEPCDTQERRESLYEYERSGLDVEMRGIKFDYFNAAD